MTQFGNEDSVNALRLSANKKIVTIVLVDHVLQFTFMDGSILSLADDGQLCCESRYMTSDDNFKNFIGGNLLGISLEDAPSVSSSEEDNVHDVQFLHVKTSKGSFTVENHVEHNGYYSGFDICAQLILPQEK